MVTHLVSKELKQLLDKKLNLNLFKFKTTYKQQENFAKLLSQDPFMSIPIYAMHLDNVSEIRSE